MLVERVPDVLDASGARPSAGTDSDVSSSNCAWYGVNFGPVYGRQDVKRPCVLRHSKCTNFNYLFIERIRKYRLQNGVHFSLPQSPLLYWFKWRHHDVGGSSQRCRPQPRSLQPDHDLPGFRPGGWELLQLRLCQNRRAKWWVELLAWLYNDDVAIWKRSPWYRPFVWRIDRWPLDSPHERPVTRTCEDFRVASLNKLLD